MALAPRLPIRPLAASYQRGRRARRGRKARLGPGAMLLALSVFGCADETRPPKSEEWQIVFDDLESSVFSVWGSGQGGVWFVGADAGSGPLVLEYDGERFIRHETGAEGTLFWVSGLGDDIWMSGEGGLVLRYSTKRKEFSYFTLPGAATLFGVYPLAKDDVWAVGGDAIAKHGAAYRFDGDVFSEVLGVPDAARRDALFKVWGPSAEDLWVVGLGGSALHRTAEGWQELEVPGQRRLFTVHGAGERVIAVGGYVSGLIAELSTGEAEDVTPKGAPQLNGVWVKGENEALAVGNEGSVWELKNEAWQPLTDAPALRDDYHAVYTDDEGGSWLVGGRIAAEPYNHGVIVRRGGTVRAVMEREALPPVTTKESP